jgi:hypothetical protein
VSAEPRDQRLAHALVRVRRLELLGAADRPPVFHVFEEFYARSLHGVEGAGGPADGAGEGLAPLARPSGVAPVRSPGAGGEKEARGSRPRRG